MPGMPDLPHDAPFQHQGQYDGEHDQKQHAQTHRGGTREHLPALQGKTVDQPLRYDENGPV